MRNDELLRQLGWSDALITEMSQTAAQIEAVTPVSDVLGNGYGLLLSVTTDRVLYQGGGYTES